MTYTYDDIITAKDILADRVKQEDIIGKEGWFLNCIPRDFSEKTLEYTGSLGELFDFDCDANFPFYDGGLCWQYFLPKKKPTYEERQAEWIKENDIKTGDKVRIVRKARDNEGGWDNNWAPSMSDAVGEVGCVIEDPSASGIRVETDDCSFAYPYFVLEKVADKPDYTEADIISSPDDPRLKNAIGKQVYYQSARSLVLLEAIGDALTGTLTGIDENSGLSFFSVNNVSNWRYIIIKKGQPEPEFIPFDLSKKEDRARLRGAWIRRKDYPGDEYQIVGISITNNLIFFDDSAQLVTDVLLERCEFVDGSPCGKLANTQQITSK